MKERTRQINQAAAAASAARKLSLRRERSCHVAALVIGARARQDNDDDDLYIPSLFLWISREPPIAYSRGFAVNAALSSFSRVRGEQENKSSTTR